MSPGARRVSLGARRHGRCGRGGEPQDHAKHTIRRDLFLAGLLDELILITHPVIAGGSFRRLFQPGDPTTRLELTDLVRTSAGNAVLTYRRRVD